MWDTFRVGIEKVLLDCEYFRTSRQETCTRPNVSEYIRYGRADPVRVDKCTHGPTESTSERNKRTRLLVFFVSERRESVSYTKGTLRQAQCVLETSDVITCVRNRTAEYIFS